MQIQNSNIHKPAFITQQLEAIQICIFANVHFPTELQWKAFTNYFSLTPAFSYWSYAVFFLADLLVFFIYRKHYCPDPLQVQTSIVMLNSVECWEKNPTNKKQTTTQKTQQSTQNENSNIEYENLLMLVLN